MLSNFILQSLHLWLQRSHLSLHLLPPPSSSNLTNSKPESPIPSKSNRDRIYFGSPLHGLHLFDEISLPQMNWASPNFSRSPRILMVKIVSFCYSHKPLSEIFAPPTSPSFADDSSRRIRRVFGSNKWSESVAMELHELNVQLSGCVVVQVLRSLSDSETAFHFYLWAETRSGFAHDRLAVESVIGLLLKDRNFGLLHPFLTRVRNQGFPMHRFLYRVLIGGYVRSGMIDLAIRTFNEMVESGCEVLSVDYNKFIGVLVANCCFDLAEKYYNDMILRGFSLSSFTYSRFISGLCVVNNISLVEKLFEDMNKLDVSRIFGPIIYIWIHCAKRKDWMWL